MFTWLQRPTEYATSVGEQRVVQLADGSRVHLDTASEIRVRFSGAGRIVTLDRGQAFFEVAPDASRPFTVEAGQASVTALGTSFDVRRSGGSTQVVLVTGRVEVKSVPGAPAKVMAPGQAAVLSGSAPVVSAADVERATSWKQGRLIFRDTPLPVAVAEINRYLDKGIVLDAPGLSQTTVNGVFETGDRDAFVSTAAEVFGLRAVPGPDGTVRLVVH